MTLYRYRATAENVIRTGTLEAAHERDLEYQLSASGLVLISARAHKPIVPSLSFLQASITPATLSLFCAQSADLLEAGLPLLAALAEIQGSLPPSPLSSITAALAQKVAEGQSLSAACASFPKCFSPAFCAALRAGEAAGALAPLFRQLSDHLRAQDKLTRQIHRALRYPLFLILVAGGASTFMLTSVVPQLVSFLQSMNDAIPASTRFLIAAAHDAVLLATLMLWIVPPAFLLLFLLCRTSPAFALRLDAFFLRLPFIGTLLREAALARFTQSFALLLAHHVPLDESLALSAPLLRHRSLIAFATRARENLRAGTPLSRALSPILPPFLAQIIRIGEQSATLPKAMNNAARLTSDHLQAHTETLIGALEPTLTLGVGLMLAWVVLAVLGPLYSNLASGGFS